MAKIFTTSARVRFSDLDPYGHVHHAEMFTYFEWARMEYLKQSGISFSKLMKQGIFIVIVNATVNFHSPAYFDEDLVISGFIKKIGNTSLTMIQSIEEKNSKRHIAEAQFTFVCLDGDRRKIPVPRDVLKSFLE